MLYSRLTAHKLQNESVRHIDITTMKTRTSASADKVLLFRPGTDLAIANCVANYLIQNKKYDADFVRDHLQFKMGTENIGNAYEDGYDKSDLGKSVDKPPHARLRNTPRAWRTIRSSTRASFRAFLSRTC